MANEADGVELLAGGNPQVPKGDGDEPVRAYIAAMPGWKGRIGRHLDDLVREAVPHARRAVRWNSPFYGIDGQGWFLNLHCFTRYVKVTWLNGGELDPSPPEATKYERVRHLNITEEDEVDDERIRDWLRQAASIPGEDMF